MTLKINDRKKTFKKVKNSLFEIISILGIIFCFFCIIKYYGKLPSKIPNHYSSPGKIKDFMPKGIFIVLGCINLGIYILFTILKKHPNWSNYPVEVNEKNKEVLYKINNNLVLYVKAQIVWIFNFMMLNMINNVLGKGSLSIIVSLLIISVFITLIVFTKKMSRESKKISKNR